jgi:alpha-beta hydrolase superfamily lysophospholipase
LSDKVIASGRDSREVLFAVSGFPKPQRKQIDAGARSDRAAMNRMPLDFGALQNVDRETSADAESGHSATSPHRSPVSSGCPDFGRPVVFGDPGRPLAGRVHEASGQLLGAVVICNPWGYEENCAHAAFQQLAHRLSERGFEVLRFDYEGCGDSWGDSTEPQQLARWIASCGAAISFMSERTGCAVGVIGLRMGATLCALASAAHPVAATVLWDPIVNGHRYLRGIRAVSMMGVKSGPVPSEPGSLMTIGHYLNANTVEDLERLDLKTLTEVRLGETLIIGRPAAPDPKRLSASLQALGVQATLEEYAGTDKLLDCAAEQAVIPGEIIDRIAHWMAEHPSGAARKPPELATSATMDVPGADWVEEHICVGRLRLSGVLTLPRHPRRAGAVVLSNNGVARAIGPARAWVEWARRWAGLGIASLRLDLSGLGESPRHPRQRADNQYPIEAIDDFAAAVEELTQRGLAPVVAVGLCSGAFLSLDAAAASSGVSGVAAINSQLFHLPDLPGSPDRLRRAAPPTHPWLQRFMENTRGGRYLARKLPYPAWRTFELLRLQPSPLAGAAAAAKKARILLIYGDDNLGLVRLRQRARGLMAKWRRDGQLTVIHGLDHSMFVPQIRDQVESEVRPFLLSVLPEIR